MSDLTEQENTFIKYLFDGLSIKNAAREAGYNEYYGYTLRKRLSKAIIEAGNDHLAMHTIDATSRIINSINNPMPNPAQITAAMALLDRVGITKKDGSEIKEIKANIFILPDKKDHEAPA